jgi:tetratricopeptide (TPR) repeat protein
VPRFTRRPAPSERPVTALVPLLAVTLVIAGVLAYSNSFGGPFVLDDFPGITHNPSIRSLWPPHWLSAPPRSGTSGRPFLNFTLAFNYAFGGLNVSGYHALNLLIHLANGLALFGVVRRTLTSDRLRAQFGDVSAPLAFAVALVWSVHPLTTGAVTYIIQRGESLASLFLLLTLYYAIRGRTWGAAIACALGMATKETMILTPALVVLWDRLFREDGATRRRLYGALAATLIVLFVPMLSETQGRITMLRALGYIGKVQGDSWTSWSYLWTQAGVITHYLVLVFRPWPLAFDYYDWPQARSPFDVLPQALLIATLFALTVVAVVRKWPAGFAGAVFFLVLAPTSSLLPLPMEVAAEHRMYLPLAAVIALTLIGLGALGPAPRLRIAAAILLMVVFIGAASVTRVRNMDYSSAAALWGDAVHKRPGNARARIYYGLELVASNQYAADEALMRGALPLTMDRSMRGAVYLQLGSTVAAQGRLDEAVGYLERARELDPKLHTADVMLDEIRRRKSQ